MSLYCVQKILFQVNNDAGVWGRFATDRTALLADYRLTEAERRVLHNTDIGTLYVMGVHPLLLAPFAGHAGLRWPDYIAELRRAKPPATPS